MPLFLTRQNWMNMNNLTSKEKFCVSLQMIYSLSCSQYTFITIYSYMEILIQFGYATLFASAYPLASSIMIIANLVEIRSDTFKLTFICRKPRSLRCDGLGMWGNLLKGLVTLSALTNCLIFGFTSGQLMEWLPSLYIIDESDHMRFSDNKGWLVIFIIFGAERALLLIKFLVNAIIPDIPEDVMDKLERKHYVQEEESRQFERSLKSKDD